MKNLARLTSLSHLFRHRSQPQSSHLINQLSFGSHSLECQLQYCLTITKVKERKTHPL